MNPINKVTGAITHPLRTATSVAGGALHVAAAGVRTASRLVGRPGDGETSSAPSTPTGPPAAEDTVDPGSVDTVEHAEAHAEGFAPAESQQESTTEEASDDVSAVSATKPAARKTPAERTATERASAKKTPAKKTSAKRTSAKKAPSARAATVGPALAAVPDAGTDTGADTGPDVGPAARGPLEDDTTHLETETEVVYTSETSAGSGPDEPLTEPLLDPSLAAALKDEVPGDSSESGDDSDG